MAPLDYIVMAVYCVSILASGVIFSRTGANMKSFFAADGEAPWWLSGLSLYMSFFSAGAFVVWGGMAYEHGLVALNIQWTTSLCGFAVAIFLAHRWKRTGVMTVGEFIRHRLGAGAQQFYTYAYTFFGVFTAGGLLYPVSKMVSVTSGLPLPLCCAVLGAVITIYTAVGGLWAVLVTDTLQFVVLMAALLIAAPLALRTAGGIESLVAGAPEGYFHLVHGPYNWLFVVAYALYHLYMLGGKWPYVQRYTSVPDERSARKVAALFGVLYIFNPVLFFLPAMLYRTVNPHLTGLQVEDAFILMARKILPTGLVGLMLAAMLSSSASAANTMLNMLSAVFTRDIYQNLIRRDASERASMIVARLSTCVFGALMITVALIVPLVGGLVEMILSLAAITGGATLLPPIWALCSKRISASAAITASAIALGASVFLKILGPPLLGLKLNRAAEMAVGVGIPTVVLIVFELALLARGVVSPGVARFEAHRASLRPSGGASSVQSRFGATVVAYSILFIGTCLLLLGWLAPHSQRLVLSVAALVLAVGALAVWLLHRSQAAPKLIDQSPGPQQE